MRDIKFRAWSKKDKLMLPWSTIRQSAFNNSKDGFGLLYQILVTRREDFHLMLSVGLKDSANKWLKKENQELYEGDLVQVIDWEVESIGSYSAGDNMSVAGKNFKVLKVEKHSHPDYEKRAEVYYYLCDRIREITYDNEEGFLPMQDANNQHGWG